MDDSSDDGGLFDNSSEDAGNKEEQERMQASQPPPPYVKSEEFMGFQKTQFVQCNQKYGYIFIHTYKPFYFPGEIVRGSIILDFFNDLPSDYKNVVLSFTGREKVGKYYNEVKESISKQISKQQSLKQSQAKSGAGSQMLDVIQEKTENEDEEMNPSGWTNKHPDETKINVSAGKN